MERDLPVNIVKEMRQSYLDYSMSVIVGRALPDVRDGFKPVHRRILYAMFSEGLLSNRKFSKCAGVVGEVLKKYHPHGDSAVYDALVRLAQPWNMRYPLVEGQGNFGSIDGDRAAAYRYTEARMQLISEEMLSDIDKETVNWQNNFDESTREPLVLPTRFPNLLVNGSSGIAVGMATNIPPHNIVEITNALLKVIEDPDVSFDELAGIVKGPDFPTGGIIYGRQGIEEAYLTGRGKVLVRSKTHFEEHGERTWIVVDEIPYMVNKSKILEKIADLVKEGRISGIAELRDESDRHGMRIVIELKRGEVPEINLNKLLQMTPLQTTFGIIMLALVDNQPKVLNLKEILDQFVAFRRQVVLRRTRYLLRKAEARAHILEGLVKALDVIDELIKLIRASDSPATAKSQMIEKWAFSEIQAQAILDMRLQKLTGLERQKILDEHSAIQEEIKALKLILENEQVLKQVLIDETKDIRDRFGDERRTLIVDQQPTMTIEDFIADETVVVTLSHKGYIKQTPVEYYREQRRGGKGRMGMKTHDDDFVNDLFIADTHDQLMVFTSFGKVHLIKVHQIPQADAATKGKAIVNLIPLEENEKPVAFHAIREFSSDIFLIFITKNGIVKKTVLSAYRNIRASGIRAININDDDELINVRQTNGNMDILLATKHGKAIRFSENDLRSMGRVSTGVKGIQLRDDDLVVEMAVIAGNDGSLLTVSEEGFGKKTPIEEYRQQRRGGSGLLNMKLTEKTGEVIGVRYLNEINSVILISQFGKLIRMDASNLRDIGRVTQGVRLLQLDDEDDRVVGMGLVPIEDENIKDIDQEDPDGENQDSEPESTDGEE